MPKDKSTMNEHDAAYWEKTQFCREKNAANSV